MDQIDHIKTPKHNKYLPDDLVDIGSNIHRTNNEILLSEEQRGRTKFNRDIECNPFIKSLTKAINDLETRVSILERNLVQEMHPYDLRDGGP